MYPGPEIPVRNETELCLFYVQNLFAVVVTANLANTVGTNHLTASRVGALYHCGHRQLAVIRASLISASTRNLFLWYCH